MLKRFSIYLLFSAIPCLSMALEGSTTSTSSANPETVLPLPPEFDWLKKDKKTITIPLKRVGNLFFIEAKIEDQVGNFVLDLGAPYLVLNATYFRDYEVDENYYAGTLVSGTDYVRRKEVGELDIHGLIRKGLTADVADLGAIENEKNIKILGLLGVEIFRGYVFDLDVIHQQLVLHPSLDEVDVEEELILEAPIIVHNNLITIQSKLKKVKVELSLDTGAETNILHNKLPTKVYNGMKILKTSVLRDGNGASAEAVLALLDGIKIQDTKLKKMPTMILNLRTMSRAYDSKIDGMLGFPFFAMGRTVLDFRKKRLYIYKFKSD